MTEQTGIELSAKRVGPPRALRALPAVAAGISVVSLMCLQTQSLRWLWLSPAFLGPVFAGSAGVAMFGERVARRLFPRAEGALRVEDESLYWKGVPLFAKGAIRDAIAYRNGPRHGVRVQTAWRTEHFEVQDPLEADGIVAALGKDSRQAALAFSGVGNLFAASSYMILAWWAHTWAWLVGGLGLFAVVAVLVSRLRTRWVVGADGLLVTSAFRRTRFVPYRDVVSMTVTGGTLDIALRDWSHETMRAADDVAASVRPVVGVRALQRRIEQARAHAARATPEATVTKLLARGERDVAAWMQELTELEARPATYRAASVGREALWSTLEDAAQPAELRAAAATALRPRLEDTERARLRVAAGACASPKLRVALDAASSENEEALSKALEDVSADENHVARRLRGAARK